MPRGLEHIFCGDQWGESGFFSLEKVLKGVLKKLMRKRGGDYYIVT